MKTRIIAFGHKRFVGKDTATKLLTTYLRLTQPGLRIHKGSFADKLKDVSYQLYAWAGLKDAHYYEDNPREKDQTLPLLGMTPREIWIKLGTSAIRNNVWEKTWVCYLINNIPKCDYFIIQDLRFPNEANAILEAGGFVFRIDCMKPHIPAGSQTDPSINAIADTPLDDYDKWTDIIHNDGDLKEFNSTIVALAEKWLTPS